MNAIAIGAGSTASHTASVVLGANMTTIATDTTHINNLYIKSAPLYTDNAAAITAGLTAGQIYRDNYGDVKIVANSVDPTPTGGPLSASVQTTNGATTSVVTLSLGTYSTYAVEATVVAWDGSNMLSYGSQLFAVFTNGLTGQVSTTDVIEKSQFSTATSHIIFDLDPQIVVIGEASKTIDWVVNYTVTKI